MRTTTDKVIVTNLTALKAKYGASGVRTIQSALQELVTTDEKRGLITRLFAVDDPKDMKKVATPSVKNATNPKQNKVAIDGIYKALAPDYLLIVGAIDVVPHQDLKNPMYSPSDDPDRFAFGDLPYACEAPYSQRPQDFFGPTRVVGRLPDLTGGSDPRYLVGLLKTASTYKSVSVIPYHNYFGISAEIWQQSTALSLTNTFGKSSDMKTVPTSNSKWAASFLGRLSHFINCHGALNNSHFFGQPASGLEDYPEALAAAYINKRISEGTVVAAECCYGAQLYNPRGGQSGICSTYLANKGYGFFGSTTIAYGPESSNDQADLICQFFLQTILQGASLGRAALEARQKFVHRASMSDPSNVKTIAQFNLYGDPSLTPINTSHVVSRAISKAGTKVTSPKMADTATLRMERAERRRDLFSRGIALAKSQPTIRKVTERITLVRPTLQKAVRQSGMMATQTLTFTVKEPPMAQVMPKALIAKELVASRVHVIFGQSKNKKTRSSKRKEAKALATQTQFPPVVGTVALIIKEVAGKVVSSKKIFAR